MVKLALVRLVLTFSAVWVFRSVDVIGDVGTRARFVVQARETKAYILVLGLDAFNACMGEKEALILTTADPMPCDSDKSGSHEDGGASRRCCT